IHNFKHQGMGGSEVLQATGLNRDDYYFQYDRLRDNFNPFAINFMKGGIVYSNFVTTVSPHHAWEAHVGEFGYGLGHTLHIYQDKFRGVLNGIDYDVWNPESDRYIPQHYTADDLAGKAETKTALRDRLLMRDADKPLITFIGRLDDQKGVHLVHHAIYYCLSKGAQFVLLGSATEAGINAHFQHEKWVLNDNPDCHLELGFNEELSHLIYAGADMIVVPSNYEPCGLTQMEERNGYVFHQTDYCALESALDRAIGLWYDYHDDFEKLMIQGMNCDNSWKYPAKDYVEIYELIRHK
ncbi:MAG: glycosyltransferase, partial [Oscillatoriales cyanobacterium]